MRKNNWGIRTVGVCFGITLSVTLLLVVSLREAKAAVSAPAKPNDAPNLSELDGTGIPLVSEPEVASELEDRLVILPEIKREGERFFLSSFKLPDKLTFAGQSVPLDNWQVRERSALPPPRHDPIRHRGCFASPMKNPGATPYSADRLDSSIPPMHPTPRASH